jgi:hypothetical protein
MDRRWSDSRHSYQYVLLPPIPFPTNELTTSNDRRDVLFNNERPPNRVPTPPTTSPLLARTPPTEFLRCRCRSSIRRNGLGRYTSICRGRDGRFTLFCFWRTGSGMSPKIDDGGELMSRWESHLLGSSIYCLEL